jgi:hypothetical protein
MTLADRIERARSACEKALAEPGLARARTVFAAKGIGEEARTALLASAAAYKTLDPRLAAVREECHFAPGDSARFPVERLLLVEASLRALEQVPHLAVHESVQHLFCKEFTFYADPTEETLPRFEMGRFPFAAMSRIVLLRRFPAGQQQWEAGGWRRSWFAKVPPRLLAPTCAYLFRHMRGLSPYFEIHFSETVHKGPGLLARDIRTAFYRMARSLEKQPDVKGLMAAGWIRSAETIRVSPHLAFMNEPFLEAGGLLTDLGPANPSDGFLAGSKARADLYYSGQYKPTKAVALCSREQAIAWAAAHPEMERISAVKG